MTGRATMSFRARATLSAVAPPDERPEIDAAFTAMRQRTRREIALWALDDAPLTPRVAAATQRTFKLPETTLKSIAIIENEDRSRKRERIWWAVGTVVSGVVSGALGWLSGSNM
jgi:hypothetical protein